MQSSSFGLKDGKNRCEQQHDVGTQKAQTKQNETTARPAAAKEISRVAAIWQLCQTWMTNRRERRNKNTTKAFLYLTTLFSLSALLPRGTTERRSSQPRASWQSHAANVTRCIDRRFEATAKLAVSSHSDWFGVFECASNGQWECSVFAFVKTLSPSQLGSTHFGPLERRVANPPKVHNYPLFDNEMVRPVLNWHVIRVGPAFLNYLEL